MLGISIAMLEIMIAPIPPSTIVKYILDLVLLRGSRQTGVSALTIHATGLLISSLPSDHFVRPVLDELNQLIVTNPYLLEMSEPTRLVNAISLWPLTHDTDWHLLLDTMWNAQANQWQISHVTIIP